MQTIGVIGVGMMGHGIAKNLSAKGFAVRVMGRNNRAPVDDLVKRGAREAKSAAEMAADCAIVVICVAGTPEVESIVYGANGLAAAARKGLTVIDCTTSEPHSTMRIAGDLAAKGAAFADAPLARTPKEAEEGRLNAMVGAAPAVFAEIEPVLKAFCENIYHVGGVGAGHKTKLIYNLLTMGQAALIAEALAVGAKSGVDLSAFAKVVGAGGANSGIFQLIVPKALAGDYTGLQFGLDLARKDLRYYTHMAEQLGVPGFVGEAVHQTFALASAMGLGGRLVGSLIEAQEKLTGAKVAKP